MDRKRFVHHMRSHDQTVGSADLESVSDSESHDTLSSNQQSEPEFRCTLCGYTTGSGKVCNNDRFLYPGSLLVPARYWNLDTIMHVHVSVKKCFRSSWRCIICPVEFLCQHWPTYCLNITHIIMYLFVFKNNKYLINQIIPKQCRKSITFQRLIFYICSIKCRTLTPYHFSAALRLTLNVLFSVEVEAAQSWACPAGS